jgi:hypothetical protein
MRSPKQIEASRINGRRSQGPITPEGKYHSSRNNTRHGLLAQTVVLERESEERFLELLDSYMQKHQPQSPAEAALVEIMVVAQWRLLRIWGLQKLALDLDIAAQDPELGPYSVRAMYAMRGSPDTPPRPDVLQRYEITYDRQFKSALRLLEFECRHRKSPAQPYFPAHPGHTWKDEFPSRDSHGADQDPDNDPSNRDRQEADLPTTSQPCKTDHQPPQQNIPPTIRPQEAVESKPRQKDTGTPKRPDAQSPPRRVRYHSVAATQVVARHP